MLSEERIILMTKMASYECNEGKKNMAIGKYFRSDYIAIQIMKSFVYGTIAFFIILDYIFCMILRHLCRNYTKWTY